MSCIILLYKNIPLSQCVLYISLGEASRMLLYIYICTYAPFLLGRGFARRAGHARACVPCVSGNTFCMAVLLAGVALAYSSICLHTSLHKPPVSF